jgi:hypothetical protein
MKAIVIVALILIAVAVASSYLLFKPGSDARSGAPSGVETTTTQPATTQTTKAESSVLDAIENAITEKLNEEGEYYK